MFDPIKGSGNKIKSEASCREALTKLLDDFSKEKQSERETELLEKIYLNGSTNYCEESTELSTENTDENHFYVFGEDYDQCAWAMNATHLVFPAVGRAVLEHIKDIDGVKELKSIKIDTWIDLCYDKDDWDRVEKVLLDEDPNDPVDMCLKITIADNKDHDEIISNISQEIKKNISEFTRIAQKPFFESHGKLWIGHKRLCLLRQLLNTIISGQKEISGVSNNEQIEETKLLLESIRCCLVKKLYTSTNDGFIKSQKGKELYNLINLTEHILIGSRNGKFENWLKELNGIWSDYNNSNPEESLDIISENTSALLKKWETQTNAPAGAINSFSIFSKPVTNEIPSTDTPQSESASDLMLNT